MPKINTAITPTYYAYNTSTGGAISGDEGNHTLKVVADGTMGAVAASPAEVSAGDVPGLYKIVVANDENTGAMMALHGKSTTADIVIVPVFWTCESNAAQVSGTDQTANDNGADLNTLITQVGTAGDGLTAINLPNQTMDIIGNITGNLSGSVGSVIGAVGSVIGAVGSVIAAVVTDVASRTASKADVSALGTTAGQLVINDNVTAVGILVSDVPTTAEFEARTLLAAAYATLAGQVTLSSEHAAIVIDLGKILGAVAGKTVVNAAGTQVKLYDDSDSLLVTLDRTGTSPGPYTWTPTWE